MMSLLLNPIHKTLLAIAILIGFLGVPTAATLPIGPSPAQAEVQAVEKAAKKKKKKKKKKAKKGAKKKKNKNKQNNQ